MPPEGAQITTTIAGRIVDESGAPISGVTVTEQTGSATTDANGLFFIANTSVPSERTFILAKKSGYFDGARAAVPTPNGVTYMQITLASNTPIGTVDATSGGMVSLPSGGSVSLLPGGVVTSSGTPYTGTVSVSAKHLDPSNGNFTGLFAGDLTGQQTDGSQTELQSYGVIVTELHGSNGETLQPAPGNPATLTMPIAASQQSTAPVSTPLWYFDETLGMWKEEGSATKQGSSYVGRVQHFSFWNYDMYCPYGTLTGVIVCNDVPIPGVVVNLGALVEGGQPYVVTDAAGRFKVRVPANSNAVQLQVLGSQNNGLYWTNNPITENIPANVTTDVGQIALSSPCPSYLTGRLVDCGGEPVAGMILASFHGGMSYVYSQDGNFTLFVGAGETVSIGATAGNGATAQPQTLTAGSQGSVVSMNDIVACNGTSSDVNRDISGSFSGSSLAFNSDGSQIAALSSATNQIAIYNVSSGTVTIQFTAASAVASLQFSADGSKILALEGNTWYQGKLFANQFECWNTNGTKLTTTPVSANSGIFTKDGSGVIAWTANGVIQYDLSTNTIVKTFSLPSPTWLNGAPTIEWTSSVVGLAGNGSQLIAISNSAIYMWDLASDQSIDTIQVGSTGDSIIANYNSVLSPDGTIIGIYKLVSVAFYNTQSRTKISTGTIAVPSQYSYALVADDTRFIAQYQSGGGSSVGLFHITDGTSSYLFDAPASFGNSSGVAISSDGKLAAAVYANEIRIWNVK